MRTVAYVRVSSRAQTQAMQVDAIRREADARRDRVGAWYAERLSGKALERPELARLRADVAQGRVGKVYVFRLDRLTRSGVADTFRVVDELRRAGVTLVSVSDNLTIKPGEDLASDVLVFALALAAKIERTAINERIAAARSRVESEGGAWGRPRRLVGATVATMVGMKNAGKTIRQIAIATKVPRSSVARALRGWDDDPGGSNPIDRPQPDAEDWAAWEASQKGPAKTPAKRPRDPGSDQGAAR